MCFKCRRKKEYQPRTLYLGGRKEGKDAPRYPPNIIRNQKYNIISFVPLVGGSHGVSWGGVGRVNVADCIVVVILHYLY